MLIETSCYRNKCSYLKVYDDKFQYFLSVLAIVIHFSDVTFPRKCQELSIMTKTQYINAHASVLNLNIFQIKNNNLILNQVI